MIESPRLLVVQSFVHQQVQGVGVDKGADSVEATATATATVTSSTSTSSTAAMAEESAQLSTPPSVPRGVPVTSASYQGVECVVVTHYSEIHKHEAITHFPSLV